jgi:hypothetical protein
MKRTQPKRTVLPAIPKPGAEVVFRKISHIPHGGIVYTVSYLESNQSDQPQAKKRPFFVKKGSFLFRFVSVLSRIRGVLGHKLSRLRAMMPLS